MTVNAVKDGTKLTIEAEGKFGTTSAPEQVMEVFTFTGMADMHEIEAI